MRFSNLLFVVGVGLFVSGCGAEKSDQAAEENSKPLTDGAVEVSVPIAKDGGREAAASLSEGDGKVAKEEIIDCKKAAEKQAGDVIGLEWGLCSALLKGSHACKTLDDSVPLARVAKPVCSADRTQ